MNLKTVQHMAEKYDLTKNAIYVMASYNKTKTGEYPRWYVQKGTSILIDEYYFNFQQDISFDVWKYNTEKLYWVINDFLELGDYQLSNILAVLSNKFKSNTSWAGFISGSLFSLPDETRRDLKYTMAMSFLELGTYLVYNVIKIRKGKSMIDDLSKIRTTQQIIAIYKASGDNWKQNLLRDMQVCSRGNREAIEAVLGSEIKQYLQGDPIPPTEYEEAYKEML